MPVDVVMPSLSDTMEEGVLLRWLKKPGDPVHKGDAIAEVETDKANMEVEAFDEGTMSELLVEEGGSAPVGAPIARLTLPGEEEPQAKSVEPSDEKEAESSAEQQNQGQESEPAIEKVEAGKAPPKEYHRLTNLQDTMREHPVTEETLSPSERRKKRLAGAEAEEAGTFRIKEGAESIKSGEPVPPLALERTRQSGQSRDADERVKASPRARKLAKIHGVALTTLQGSGPDGRIVETDVMSAASIDRPESQSSAGSSAGQSLSRMRQTIAQRMVDSKRQAPHFYVTVSVRADQLVKLRSELKRQFEISYNDFIIKACAMALQRHPRLNASFREERLIMNEGIHIAQAVAVPDGLMTPVLHDVAQLSLEELASQSAELIARTHMEHLKPEDLSGATFTISNMGMYDVEDFVAIINPPQSAILAVGAIQEVPVVENGAVIPGHQLKLTLSADHRVLNGVEAAEFLGTLKHLLENPVLLSETDFQRTGSSEIG